VTASAPDWNQTEPPSAISVCIRKRFSLGRIWRMSGITPPIARPQINPAMI
jgi:hypothetical protein